MKIRKRILCSILALLLLGSTVPFSVQAAEGPAQMPLFFQTDYLGEYGSNNIDRLEYASDMLQLPWRKAENVHEAMDAMQEGDLAIE